MIGDVLAVIPVGPGGVGVGSGSGEGAGVSSCTGAGEGVVATVWLRSASRSRLFGSGGVTAHAATVSEKT